MTTAHQPQPGDLNAVLTAQEARHRAKLAEARAGLEHTEPFLYVGTGGHGVFIAARWRWIDQADHDMREPGREVLEQVDVTHRFEEIARNLGWVRPHA